MRSIRSVRRVCCQVVLSPYAMQNKMFAIYLGRVGWWVASHALVYGTIVRHCMFERVPLRVWAAQTVCSGLYSLALRAVTNVRVVTSGPRQDHISKSSSGPNSCSKKGIHCLVLLVSCERHRSIHRPCGRRASVWRLRAWMGSSRLSLQRLGSVFPGQRGQICRALRGSSQPPNALKRSENARLHQ